MFTVARPAHPAILSGCDADGTGRQSRCVSAESAAGPCGPLPVAAIGLWRVRPTHNNNAGPPAGSERERRHRRIA